MMIYVFFFFYIFKEIKFRLEFHYTQITSSLVFNASIRNPCFTCSWKIGYGNEWWYLGQSSKILVILLLNMIFKFLIWAICWQIFVNYFYSPKLELRLTLIKCNEVAKNLGTMLLRPSMPLTHLKVLFCREVSSKYSFRIIV